MDWLDGILNELACGHTGTLPAPRFDFARKEHHVTNPRASDMDILNALQNADAPGLLARLLWEEHDAVDARADSGSQGPPGHPPLSGAMDFLNRFLDEDARGPAGTLHPVPRSGFARDEHHVVGPRANSGNQNPSRRLGEVGETFIFSTRADQFKDSFQFSRLNRPRQIGSPSSIDPVLYEELRQYSYETRMKLAVGTTAIVLTRVAHALQRHQFEFDSQLSSSDAMRAFLEGCLFDWTDRHERLTVVLRSMGLLQTAISFLEVQPDHLRKALELDEAVTGAAQDVRRSMHVCDRGLLDVFRGWPWEFLFARPFIGLNCCYHVQQLDMVSSRRESGTAQG